MISGANAVKVLHTFFYKFVLIIVFTFKTPITIADNHDLIEFDTCG